MTRTLGRTLISGASLVALAAVVACGGGGGGGGQSSLPGTAGQAQATFTIAVPSGGSSSSSVRRAAFVSPNAQSISIAVAGATTTANLTPTSPGCTPATSTVPLTCTISLYAPPGNDSFIVTLYAGLNASGTVLAMSTVSAIVSATQPTVVPVTLGGVVASIDVTVTNGNQVIPGGYATTLPVIVTAKDPSGAAIVGAGTYTNPITLTNADMSGVTQLSTTTVTSPQTVVTLAYAPTDANSGVISVAGLPVGATTIGASATGVPPSAVTPGTFRYIADRFFGMGHLRTLSGTGAVTVITYNGAGVPSPNPSTWSYTIADALTVQGGLTYNGVPVVDSHHVITYTQTSPVTAVSPEVETRDTYRFASVAAAGAILYRQGQLSVNVNSGAISSPITGNPPGTVSRLDTYSSVTGWQEDVLPHVNGATWSDSNVPFTQTYTNAEVATFQQFADGSWTFNETAPSTIAQTQSAKGTATNDNNGIATSIGLPSGSTIPVAQQTASPVPGPTAYYSAANWYPGGGAPVPPLYSSAFAEVQSSIPSTCNVPAAIATQAYVLVQTNTQLDVAAFRNRQQIWTDYYVPAGIGYVCETYAETTSGYRYSTGIISSLTTVTYTIGVTNVTSLGARRSQGR